MSWLPSVVGGVVVRVGGALLLAAAAIIGPDRLRGLRGEVAGRLWRSRRALAVLGVVLVASAVGRSSLQAVSGLWGLRLTGLIHAVEGEFVGWVQTTFATPELTAYFSWVYVYGYAFLLSFPFLAYLALPRTETLERLLVAYALNYAIGLVLYTVVFAYGPRNLNVATSLLFTHNPDFTALTSEINEATNVFPSLHTSLSVTVAAFAVLTREEYPRWTPVALWLSTSVVIATMYLGIHWLTDVVGGVALAFGCVYLSRRLVDGDGDASGETEESADGDAVAGDA
ncbi:phosphatase PAP2 family protein [Halorubrum yunnanense]|uniref:Phosphatase PAP2 family protein n=1 Tax=Halorubrum yunnanense TaxID=1526162 RepID=A0ABD5YH36_9EURY|nr:phosphatase PAP2 family protein [Halorubrum yunnanense]